MHDLDSRTRSRKHEEHEANDFVCGLILLEGEHRPNMGPTSGPPNHQHPAAVLAV